LFLVACHLCLGRGGRGHAAGAVPAGTDGARVLAALGLADAVVGSDEGMSDERQPDVRDS